MNAPTSFSYMAPPPPSKRRASAGAIINLARDDTSLRLANGWLGIERRFADGRRQLLDLILPGDLLGVHRFSRVENLELIALTDASFASAPLTEGAGLLEDLARFQARIVRQVMRLGRMSAFERLADFLLELHDRQSTAKLGSGSATIQQFLKQESLADLLGMSTVHLNRSLMALRTKGLVRGPSKALTLDLAGLRAQLPS